jgi:AcrR family transcriptional regulator
MPRAFSEHEKKFIAERLLEEGHRQFAAYGLRKTSVEEIASTAGISKGAFYRFYESKEALFMGVVEKAELRFRQEVLAVIDLPGPSPKARLYAVLHKAFTLWKTIPILQIFTQGDYDLLVRRVPAETLQAHLHSDRQFIEELIARCQDAGISIQAQAEEIDGLLHALFFASLHEDDFGPGTLTDAIDLLLQLTVAFCLGEVPIQVKDARASLQG